MKDANKISKTEIMDGLKEIAYALHPFSNGGSVTNYTPYSQLMLEEKVNILTDAIILLIANEIK